MRRPARLGGRRLQQRGLLTGIFRAITGLGIGAASAVVPAYISELAPPAIRGRLGSLWQFAIVIGQLLGLLSGYGLTHLAGSEAAPLPFGGPAWRWMFAVVAVLALVYVLISLRLPWAPHDLVRHDRDEDAVAVLTRVGGGPAGERVAAIRASQDDNRSRGKLAGLRGPRLGLRGIVWAGVLLAAFQQLVGINVVKTYSNTLWQAVGLSTAAAFTVSIITVLVSVASTVVAIAIIDRVGRRTMLATGAAFMVLSLATLAGCFSTPAGDVVLARGPGITALIAMNVFAVAFGITWGPVMWVMLGELFASDIRTIAVAVCTAVNWITNYAVTQTFPTLAGIGLGFAYGLYSAFALLALVFVLKVLPETRGRALS